MTFTFTPTELTTGVNTVTVTVSDDVRVGSVFTEYNNIRFSDDGTIWAHNLKLEPGEKTVYIRIGTSLSGGLTDAIEYWLTDYETETNGYVTIYVSGGSTPQYESFNVSMSQRQTTMQYSGTLVNTPVNVGNSMRGNILDHTYDYELERVAEQGAQASVSGAAYATKLVQALITYRVKYECDISVLLVATWKRPKLSDHLAAISAKIGIPIVLIGSDYAPATNTNGWLQRKNAFSFSYYEYASGSFAEHMARLIGWSNDVPGMAYNLYIDNGTIYVVQQGYEENVITPDAWALTPVLTHTIRHTQWAESQYQSIIPREISSNDAINSNTPFSGTRTWNETTMTYEDGYLITEVTGTATTTYTYIDHNGAKYVSQKETLDTEKLTKTTVIYRYQESGTEYYLFEETMEVRDSQTDELIDSKLTRSIPTGGGCYDVTVYDTYLNEIISTTNTQGPPGQAASQYTIDAMNDAIKPAESQRKLVVELNGVAKARQTYPVADLHTLQQIAAALDTTEGREQVTLQGEIVGGTHMYTYNDKIIYKGQQYHIVSNNVSVTPASIRQSITAVRI